ncbi:MAG: protein kinase [Pyrinomonadaceae bacterium]
MTKCHSCGFEAVESEEFCSNCGASTRVDLGVEDTPAELVPTDTAGLIGSGDLAPQLNSESIDEPDALQQVEAEPVTTGDFDEPNGETSDEITPVANTSNVIGGTTDGKKPGMRALAEGTVLNARYEIVRKIGGGGMGAVYLALDNNLGGVERAVKEMVQSNIEEDQHTKAIEDFKRESTILSSLDHPSIPAIYDYFFDANEGRFYLVMKYIAGGDLAARLRSTPGGRIDEQTVTEWSLQLAEVLSYLHNLPSTVVYRDLKPSNIMIDGKSGRLMLIDFGIARSINQEEKGVTAVGTMGYAPPELFSGQVEPRSDIYSLGATMFHLLTGADPQNNPLLIFDFQKNPRPRQINPRLSDQMERILMRCVEYSAESRFDTAEELCHALTDHIENLNRGTITFGVTEIPSAVSLANQNVFCGFCGQCIVATDLFCAFCGAKQPIAQQGVHSEIYGRSLATAKLVVDGTSDLDAPVFTLEKDETFVGRRDPQSNIFPEIDLSRYDPQTKISRRHARIWRTGDGFTVEDLGSSNGTVILGGVSDSFNLRPHEPHPLANGDRLKLGDTTLHFLMG